MKTWTTKQVIIIISLAALVGAFACTTVFVLIGLLGGSEVEATPVAALQPTSTATLQPTPTTTAAATPLPTATPAPIPAPSDESEALWALGFLDNVLYPSHATFTDLADHLSAEDVCNPQSAAALADSELRVHDLLLESRRYSEAAPPDFEQFMSYWMPFMEHLDASVSLMTEATSKCASDDLNAILEAIPLAAAAVVEMEQAQMWLDLAIGEIEDFGLVFGPEL